MISIVLYGRNDNYGYNLHKRAALSLNCMAHLLTAATDEIIFVDYNTPDDLPTFPEAIQDTLTDKAKRHLRILRVRPSMHARFADRTHLQALEPIARNVAVRRSNPANRWILSTNTDMIFVPRRGRSLTTIASKADDGFYHLPRFEIPESLWETLDRRKPKQVIRTVEQWGRSLHLNEIVYLNDIVRFDGPGDFQMILRDDLFRIHGFDERMLVGWHVDSNIAKRLTLLRGGVRDVLVDLYGYHCDHTRQVTPAHRPGGVQNDMSIFFEDVQVAELKEQSTQWGLANDTIEEVRLRRRGWFFGMFGRDDLYVGALRTAIRDEMRNPSSIAYKVDTYDQIGYDANHVIPFLADAVVCYPRDTRLGWIGCRHDLLVSFAKAWRAMGFTQDILVAGGSPGLDEPPPGVSFAALQQIASDADVFVFDFGLPARTGPDDTGLPETERALARVARGLRMITRVERSRMEIANVSPRRMIAVNAIHNRFGSLVSANIGAALAPISTRLRQGFVVNKPELQQLLDLFALGAAGKRAPGRVNSVQGVAGYIVYGPGLDLDPGNYRFRLRFEVADLSSVYNADSQALQIHINAGMTLIAYYIMTAADLRRGEITVPFTVTQELADSCGILAAEFRLETDGRISISLVDAVLEVVPSDKPHEPEEIDWLPLMSIGDAGKRRDLPETGAVQVSSTGEGYVVFGPYWDLLPGRHEVTIDFDRADAQEIGDGVNDGLVVIDVVASRRFTLGLLTIPARDFHPGSQRIAFNFPRTGTGWNEEVGLEYRVQVIGEVPFTIRSVRTRQLVGSFDLPCEFEWLPVMSLGPAGERCVSRQVPQAHIEADAAAAEPSSDMAPLMRSPREGQCVRAIGDGFLIFGPYCDLMPGQYELAIDFLTDGPLPDDGRAIIDVIAHGETCLAELSISQQDLRSSTQYLQFEVSGDLAAGPHAMRLEFRVRIEGGLHLVVGSVRTLALLDKAGLSSRAEAAPVIA